MNPKRYCQDLTEASNATLSNGEELRLVDATCRSKAIEDYE
jgi:hypothetical protein